MFVRWETVGILSAEHRANLNAWLVKLGLDPSELCLPMIVSPEGLHVTRYLTDDQGLRYIGDWAANSVATEPVIVPLTEAQYNELLALQVVPQDVLHGLEVLRIAAQGAQSANAALANATNQKD